MRRRWCWAFLVAGTIAAVAVRLLPGDLPPAFAIDAIELSAAVAVVVGVRHNRPSHATAWYLLATGIGLLAIADLSWDLADTVAPAIGGPHALANVLYLCAYPFLLAGLLQLARARTTHGDREALADAAIVAAAALIPAWQFFVVPELTASISTFEQVSALLYPMLDLVLIAALARMLFGRTSRATSFRLLLAGFVVTTAADVVYLRLLAHGQPTAGWLDPAWSISYVLMGAAALHPSMRVLSERTAPRPVGLARTRLALLASALFVGPAVVVIEDTKGHSVDPRIFGPMSVLVAALVTWRLVRLAGDANRSAEALQASAQRFRALVQHATDVIGVVDPDGRLEYVSPAIVDVLGYEPEHYLGTSVAEHMHPDDVPTANAMVIAALGHPGQVFRFQARGRHRDGTWRWLETSCTNHLDEPGVNGIVGNFHDVTERTRAELLLAGETRVLETIARSAPIHETLTTLATTIDEQLDDGHCAILLADEAAGISRLVAAPGLPMSVVEVIASIPGAHVDSRNDPAAHVHETVVVEDLASDPLWARHADLLHAQGVRGAWSTPILGTDPERRFGTFSVFFQAARGPSPHERTLVERFTSLAAIALDRTAAEERLEFLALHDALTGLPNRALVLDRLHQALLRLERRHSVLAVLFLDLDRFKVINDSLGHHTGDELLVAVGKRIAAVVRPSDTVARLGGDEFVVVCEDVGGSDDAERIAERIAAALTRPFPLAQGEVVVTASIGIALSDASTNEPDTLLRDADAAMYLAKERGRARHELFGERLRSRAVVRLATERALRRAVDRDELRIYYQPQVDLRRHEIATMEALLRWQHPTRGLLSPSEFLAVAEETGLIVPIGAWVLDFACAHAAQWRLTSPSAPAVSVNLSACQLSRPDLPELVERLLAAHALEPDALCLEVTETVLLENVEVTATALDALADIGVRLAMDDFGTGYSSLSYLKRFPFHELKIDRGFVAGLGSDDADDAIVAATIQMAHALELLVTAEGVETAVQLRRLEELGCDAAQGFYFGSPQPIESLRLSLDADGETRRLA